MLASLVLAADSYVPQVGLGLVVGGIVGLLIGNAKNRPLVGLLLGAILGCIGWIIIAVLPRKD